MIVALQGDFSYSFLLGIAAAVNPCGFVMLPAYLTYYLGVEDLSIETSARVRRALHVGAAVSAGFIAVFLIVGAITRLFTGWLQEQSKWAGLGIGVVMMLAGVAMLFGWRPFIATGRLAPTVQRNRSNRSMFVFGVAYAVASIGCTIGFLVSAIFGSYGRQGYLSGVVSTGLYGAGMALLVTSLTVTVAVAQGRLLRRVRSLGAHLHTASGVVLILTGSYLAWYWYGAIYRVGDSDIVTEGVGMWQVRLHDWLQQRGAPTLAVVLGAIVLTAAVVARRRRGRIDQESKDTVGVPPG